MKQPQLYVSERQKLTARAQKIGACINHFVCEKVTTADAIYYVTTQSELDTLIDQLEKMHNENNIMV
jgi:hypothetical protein